MLLLSSGDSRRPQIGDAPSEICPLPAHLGVGFRRPAFGPHWDRRGCGRPLWLLRLEVVGLHTRWMRTRDSAKAERRSNRPAIHLVAYVERSLVSVLLCNGLSRSLLLLLRWGFGMVDDGVLAVVTPTRGVLCMLGVFWAVGRAVNIADVSRCSWTRRAATCPSVCASRLDVHAYATRDAIRHCPRVQGGCLRGAYRQPPSRRFTSVCRRF